MQTALQKFPKRLGSLLFLFLIIAGYFTYVHNFSNPPSLFWDENYHISSAQKYLNGIHFMEPHPPLGKMLIAAGEKILQRNELNDQFTGTDYGKNLPADFSFTGYRLFPTLFGWLVIPLLFLIFLKLTKNPLFSAIFTFPYLFDNAQIVHSRAAMLDSTMMFFAVATILFYLMTVEESNAKKFIAWSLLWGVAFGLLMATKILGLILILLVPAAFWQLRKKSKKRVLHATFFFLAGSLLAYGVVWHIHFSIAKEINPILQEQGYYQASGEYKASLDKGEINFPVMLRENLNYLKHYEKGVPRLDMCKPDENGSPYFLWPVGGRSINYRWETPDGESYRYLQLVINPVAWLLGLTGVILGGTIVLASVFFPIRQKLNNYPQILVFFVLWVAYMIAVARIDRVMYLYHYFIPLVFSFILFGLVFMELRQIGKWKLDDKRKASILLALGALVFVSFQIYRPFTYYNLLTDEEVQSRAVYPLWELHCATCSRNSTLVNPRKS